MVSEEVGIDVLLKVGFAFFVIYAVRLDPKYSTSRGSPSDNASESAELSSSLVTMPQIEP